MMDDIETEMEQSLKAAARREEREALMEDEHNERRKERNAKIRARNFKVGQKVFLKTALNANRVLVIMEITPRTLRLEPTAQERKTTGVNRLLVDKGLVIDIDARNEKLRIEKERKEQRSRWRKQSESYR